MRCLVVSNYLILYIPNKENSIVKVLHIVYGKREINRFLEETKDI